MVLNPIIAWLVFTVLSLWEFRCVLGNGQAFLLILKPQPQSNHECTFIYKKGKQAKLHLLMVHSYLYLFDCCKGDYLLG